VDGTITVGQSTMILLGGGTGTLTEGGQSSVGVDGSLAVDSSSNGAVNLSGQSALRVGGELLSPAAAPVTSSGQSTARLGGVEKIGPEADPFAALAAPDTAGMTVHNSSSISGPGVYTDAVSISGQSKVQLASGVYVFDAGLTISGQSTVTSATGGVLLYFAGGTLTVSGQAGVTLSPLQSGPYSAMTVFQAHGDSEALELDGQSNVTSVAGVLYAPSAALDVSGQSGASLDGLVAKGAVVSGQGRMTVG
jgi:hypothetical protein